MEVESGLILTQRSTRELYEVEVAAKVRALCCQGLEPMHVIKATEADYVRKGLRANESHPLVLPSLDKGIYGARVANPHF